LTKILLQPGQLAAEFRSIVAATKPLLGKPRVPFGREWPYQLVENDDGDLGEADAVAALALEDFARERE
jgi:hypothetical protein